MSTDLDVLQIEEDFRQFLAAGTQLGVTNLDFQKEHASTEGKVMASSP